MQDLAFLSFTLPEVAILMPTKKPRGGELPLEQDLAGLDHMEVYTCGKKFLPTSSNCSVLVKSMAKANHPSKYGECLLL